MIAGFALALVAPHTLPVTHTSTCGSSRMSLLVGAASSLSFEDAVATAPSFCAALQAGQAPEGLKDFIASSAGARGFFVNYLTSDDWTCADNEDVPSGVRANAMNSIRAPPINRRL